MKVVCITHELFGWTDEQPFDSRDPQVGDICEVAEVSRECVSIGFITAYTLVGYDVNTFYDARNFVPVSEIDETTFERKYKKEYV